MAANDQIMDKISEGGHSAYLKERVEQCNISSRVLNAALETVENNHDALDETLNGFDVFLDAVRVVIRQYQNYAADLAGIKPRGKMSMPDSFSEIFDSLGRTSNLCLAVGAYTPPPENRRKATPFLRRKPVPGILHRWYNMKEDLPFDPVCMDLAHIDNILNTSRHHLRLDQAWFHRANIEIELEGAGPRSTKAAERMARKRAKERAGVVATETLDIHEIDMERLNRMGLIRSSNREKLNPGELNDAIGAAFQYALDTIEANWQSLLTARMHATADDRGHGVIRQTKKRSAHGTLVRTTTTLKPGTFKASG